MLAMAASKHRDERVCSAGVAMLPREACHSSGTPSLILPRGKTRGREDSEKRYFAKGAGISFIRDVVSLSYSRCSARTIIPCIRHSPMT